MLNTTLFKIINVTEAILVTFLFSYGLFDTGGPREIPLKILAIIFLIPLATIINMVINIKLLQFYANGSKLEKSFKIFFWIGYVIFSCLMIIVGFFVISAVTEIMASPNPETRGKYLYTDIAGLSILLLAIYIIIVQPFFFYLTVIKFRDQTDKIINDIGRP